MARSKSKAADEKAQKEDASFNPAEFDPTMKAEAATAAVQAAEVVHGAGEPPPSESHASRHAKTEEAGETGKSFAAAVGKREFKRDPDPRGWENIKAGENRVRLLKSEGEGAWVIRFAHNPNEDKGPDGETYSKENPNPVLKMLKEEGYRWGFDGGDSKGGWGKRFEGDAYGQDHIEVRRVLQQAAEMIGQPKEQGAAISA